MKNLTCLLFCILILKGMINGQTDTVIPSANDRVDTMAQLIPADTVSKRPVISQWIMPPGAQSVSSITEQILLHHPYYGFGSVIISHPADSTPRRSKGKELFFYLIIFLLITYGTLQQLFPKYFSDLFRLFFRTTLKQRQIKEQLMQTPLPSVLLNGFFVITASLYLCFVLQHFELNPFGNFWLLFLYACAGISLVYFVKFVGLKISGWLFNMDEPANAYIFIVFVVNKMAGILLLPFLVIIAFTAGDLYTTGLTLSWCLVGGLLIYRFILTYAAIRNQVKVNPFHFFLYLCAFEIAPLLLIYKGLLLFFSISA